MLLFVRTYRQRARNRKARRTMRKGFMQKAEWLKQKERKLSLLLCSIYTGVLLVMVATPPIYESDNLIEYPQCRKAGKMYVPHKPPSVRDLKQRKKNSRPCRVRTVRAGTPQSQNGIHSFGITTTLLCRHWQETPISNKEGPE